MWLASEIATTARRERGGDPASSPTLGTPATVESESAFSRQHCFLLYLCREEMASLPRLPESAAYAADAVCRPTRRLRPLHDRRTRAVSAIRPLTLLDKGQVPRL